MQFGILFDVRRMPTAAAASTVIFDTTLPEFVIRVDARSRQPTATGAEALYRAHAGFVASFVRRLGAVEREVDDLVQETFLFVHNKGGYRPGPSTPKSWLASIAMRLLHTRRRAAARRTKREEAAGPGIAGRSPDCLDESVARRAMLERVQAALNRLPHDKATVFVLFELEGESCRAIASALGVPVGTVHSRLHSARAEFKAAIEANADAEAEAP